MLVFWVLLESVEYGRIINGVFGREGEQGSAFGNAVKKLTVNTGYSFKGVLMAHSGPGFFGLGFFYLMPWLVAGWL